MQALHQQTGMEGIYYTSKSISQMVTFQQPTMNSFILQDTNAVTFLQSVRNSFTTLPDMIQMCILI